MKYDHHCPCEYTLGDFFAGSCTCALGIGQCVGAFNQKVRPSFYLFISHPNLVLQVFRQFSSLGLRFLPLDVCNASRFQYQTTRFGGRSGPSANRHHSSVRARRIDCCCD